ncbi:GNAT superfamily N-acetyltransferase [Mesorhizobium soli]|jgi:GNAT superfamily N-acetyltransferase|uniref:GNAT family N-acetyltransferase n=1 Tax=Pseudaminobacter soli (ex Li et al. 2025) TaxID=1295366 RepID=UPI002475AF7A|nr:GNAT family N-acetyltransferase [Mesorhizobium soli]MDH6232922.1 GNAT superfamily N-acetyltransferase [Mesorhizobium soli]
MNATTDMVIRPAERADVPAIAALFAADPLGGHGDTSDAAARPLYEAAFDRIAESPNDALYVAELGGEVAGTFQTTIIVSLTGRGAATMRIEAVQTRGDLRGRGIGERMIRFAIDRAREAGAANVHLTSNLTRIDAHRFYKRLGFDQSHAGFKLKL